MAQIFHPSANSIAKASIVASALAIVFIIFSAVAVDRSPYVTGVTTPVPQPVPFSHEHHVGGLGIDCRFCHTSVETSSFAGIPALEICMTCHSQVWKNSPMLTPVRDGFADPNYQTGGSPLAWARVHQLPDYAYFNHSIHINKGVGCETCHGRVDQMPLTWKANTLHMEWCLECHRAPEKYLRPKGDIFKMGWKPPENQEELGKRLLKENRVEKSGITDCVTCHR